jgi:hypothetical protein
MNRAIDPFNVFAETRSSDSASSQQGRQLLRTAGAFETLQIPQHS